MSTNSISQGEQPGILWNYLFYRFQIKIVFAYRTFAWESEARDAAHVHVVIIGFASVDPVTKVIFTQDGPQAKMIANPVSNISPYLIEGLDKALVAVSKPPNGLPKMSWGNKPTDEGHFILSKEERSELLLTCPSAARFIHRYMSGGDFIDGNVRYCLWLKDVKPSELRAMPEVMERVSLVKDFRLKSRAPSTREYAKYPTRFRQIAQPDTDYLAIPEVSSEKRKYIPMSLVNRNVICSNTVQFIEGASEFLFGVLTSSMHMSWVRLVAGRLKSDFRYSNTLVYNNFPWPESPTEAQRAAVEREAQSVLDARALFPDSTLATLYDPVLMPPELVRAHQRLDRAVERCYRPQPFTSDRERVEFLFALYEKLTAPLLPAPATRKRRRARSRIVAP